MLSFVNFKGISLAEDLALCEELAKVIKVKYQKITKILKNS